MTGWLRDTLLPLGIPLPWRQLTWNRGRFWTALMGVTFTGILMIFQMSTYDALLVGKVLRPIHGLAGDLVLASRDSFYFYRGATFPRAWLVQAAGEPEVADVMPLYLQLGLWREPHTRIRRPALLFGVDPSRPAFTFPGLREHQDLLKQEDTLLYDRGTPRYYGPVAALLAEGGEAPAEFEGRHVMVRGLFTMGPTLGNECHLIAGVQAFFRLFPSRTATEVDLGLVRLRAGADSAAVKARLERRLPEGVQVFTREAYIEQERTFWAERTPFGFAIFAMMLVSMVTGIVVVGQILYTDVNEHLPEYATLLAVGLTQRALVRMVLAEAMLLHVMAFALGSLVTWSSFVLVRNLVDFPLQMSPWVVGSIFVFTGAMCATAGLVATHRLRTADPADII